MAQAQKGFILESQYSGEPKSSNAQALTEDTLNYEVFAGSTPSVYASPNSGYAGGNNEYGDLRKAQAFVLDSSGVLVDILLWFGAKNDGSGNPNSKLTVSINQMDGPGMTTFGHTDFGPGSIIESHDLPVSDVDTSQIISVAFTSGLIVYDDFAIMVDFSQLAAGDTIGLYSSADGDALPQRSWEQWSDSTWHTMQKAWDLEIDFAMWPVLDWSTSSINSPNFFEGIKLSQNTPNPTSGLTTIQYELAQYNAQVNFEVYSQIGQLVYSIGLQNQPSGIHTLDIDLGQLTSGTYYYSIKTDSGRLTKKLVITK